MIYLPALLVRMSLPTLAHSSRAQTPATIAHIHKVLTQILKSAVKARKLCHSPMDDVQTKPKARQEEIRILGDKELAALLAHLRGHWLYVPVLLTAATGLRRGEVLALRWSDIDFSAATLRVAQVMEFVGPRISFKEPKTERSRRTVALPASVVLELKAHRKVQAEHCLKCGFGRSELVFPRWDGKPHNPDRFGDYFKREVLAAKLPRVTFHSLRHTHITCLLRNGVPVHVVSARAGHASPTITLTTYAHLLCGDQEAAAATMDALLRSGAKPVPTT
jgi:integrase